MCLRALMLGILLAALTACGGGGDRSSTPPPPVNPAPGPGVGSPNSAPVTVNDFVSINAGSVAVSVLANDSDPDDDPLSILFTGRPSHGTVSVDDNDTPSFSGDDKVIYTANAGYVGTDIFSYTVADGRDGRANGYVTLVVGAGGTPEASANQAPIAKSDVATTQAPDSVVIDVLANDIDGDNQDLSLFSFSAAANGTVSLDDNGTADANDDRLIYVPNPGYAGSDSLVYSITDGIDVSAGTVNVLVTQADQPSAVDEVCGIVTLGPVAAASISLYEVDGRGEAQGPALARTQTDSTGRWCVTLPPDRGALLVESRGGFFQDPSDSRYEIGAARLITIAEQYTMETILPEDAAFAAITVFSNAVLRKSRLEIEGENFLSVFAGNRTQSADAFGLDVFTTDVADPVLPAADASEESRRYAMAIGAAATSLNRIAVDLNVAAPNYILIDALIRDLSECRLNGRDINGPVNVLMNGQVRQISDTIDLNLQILRFRNNLSSAYDGVELLQIDQPSCEEIVVRDDTTAPGLRALPNNMRLIPVSGGGVSLADQILQSFINSAIATDDRDGIVPVTVRLAGGGALPGMFEVGSTAVEFVATDSAGNMSEPVVRIIEIGQSGPPQSFPDVVTTPEDTAIAIDVLANDLGQENPIDSGSVQIMGSPMFGVLSVDPVSGVVTYTPIENSNGSDAFSYAVTDQGGKRSEATDVLVDVIAVNDAPVSLPDGALTRSAQSLIIDVLSNDSDVEGALNRGSLEIVSGPANGLAAVDFVSGRVVYSPAPGFSGDDSFSYRVADGDGIYSDTALVSVTVLPADAVTNVAPAAANDFILVDEDVSATIEVIGNDSDSDGLIDPGTVRVIVQPDHGSVSVDGLTGAVFYSPDPDYFGSDRFSYRVADELGLESNAADVFVNVAPVNDAPTAQNDIAQGVEDIPALVPLLANDTDVDGLAGASIMLLSQPAFGSAVWDVPSATLVYTPDPGFDGSDSLSYQVQDADGLQSAPALVTINLTGQNDAPVAADDSIIVVNNVSSALNVLDNDVDIDSPLLNGDIEVLSGPSNSVVTYDPLTDRLVYAANTGFSGSDSFTYQITDPEGLVSNIATVSLTISESQFAPVAVDDSVTAQEQVPVVIAVYLNDTDSNNDLDPSTVELDALPGNGTATVGASGDVTYTSNDNFSGMDTLTYTIADARGARSEPATVSISVSDVSEPPVALDDAVTTLEDAAVEIVVLGNDSDPESNISPDSVVIVTASQNGTTVVNPLTGTVTYTPAANFFGSDSFTYTIADTTGLTSGAATVSITVAAVNDAPVAANDSAVTDEDMAVVIAVTSNDSDLDGAIDESTVTVQATPANGTVVIDPVSGAATYTPNADFAGADAFTYRVADNEGALSGDATVTITINALNDDPVANNDVVTTDENVAVIIKVGENDTDGDGAGDLASVQMVDAPSSGTVIPGALPTEFLYTPDFNSNGSDQFSYQVLDIAGAVSNTATVDVSVVPLPSPPVTESRSASVENDTFNNIRVLRNATDPEDDIVESSVMVVSDVANGTTQVLSNGRVRYTPNPGYVGVDIFTFNVSDATGLTSNVSTVSVIVTAPGTGPVANDIDTILVFRGDTPIIDVTGDVTDADGTVDFSTLSVTNESVGSASVIGATGTIQFDLPEDFVGEATFEYGVQDNDGLASNVAEVLVTVWPSEDQDLDGVAADLEIEVGTDPDVADSVYVHIDPNTPSISPDGSSWKEAFPTLAAAVSAGTITAAPGNTVYVLMATNTDQTTVGSEWALGLAGNCDNLVFVGSLDPFVVTPRTYSTGSPRTKLEVVGAGERPVDIDDCDNIQLRHLRVSGGNGLTNGGGIRLEKSVALLDNVHVRNNTSTESGAGIYIHHGGSPAGDLTIQSSTIRHNVLEPSNNSDSSGAGIYVRNAASLSIVDSVIRHNEAPVNGTVSVQDNAGGGGLYVENTPLYISGSTIANNRTGQCGGGLHVSGTETTRLEHSIVSGNESLNLGGGICLHDTDQNLTLHNNLLASNYAATGGGLYAVDADRSRITNNTVVFNLARDSGGGMHLDPGADPVINYNIVQFNLADGPTDDVGGDPGQLFGLDASYNFVTSFFANFVGVGNSSVPVEFDAGYYLMQSSLAVNYGLVDSDDPLYALNLRYTDSSGTTTDQGLLDAGFHYLDPEVGTTNGLSILAPDGLTVGADNQRIWFVPLVNGEPLGPGHRLYVRSEQGDVATHLYTYTSDVLDPMGSGGSTQLSDLGTGVYEVLLDVPAGRSEFDLVLRIDSLSGSFFSIKVEL